MRKLGCTLALATSLAGCGNAASPPAGGAAPGQDNGASSAAASGAGASGAGASGAGASGAGSNSSAGTGSNTSAGTGSNTSAGTGSSAGSSGGGGSSAASGVATDASSPGGDGGATDDGGSAIAPAGDAASDASASDGAGGAAPLLALLPQFTAADVPVRGPKEGSPAFNWTPPATLPMRPGMGLAQHPMLYAGEGFNTIFLVAGGKVIWSYASASGGEIDDVWMLSNAHILYAHMNYLEELTPKKEVVWHYDLAAGTESHTLQPIGLDKVLFVANGQPAKIIVMNKTTGMMEVQHVLTDAGTTTHPQFRRMRMTAAGTYLAPYLEAGKVVEFDKDFNVIWTYPLPNNGSPWTALRLHNGNTLIQDERNHTAREVTPAGDMVWTFSDADLPAGITRSAPQTSERLANGDTVMFSPGGANSIQAVEVNAAKQVVWILQDWQHLGPATTAQFLDQPGIPENPGDLVH